MTGISVGFVFWLWFGFIAAAAHLVLMYTNAAHGRSRVGIFIIALALLAAGPFGAFMMLWAWLRRGDY